MRRVLAAVLVALPLLAGCQHRGDVPPGGAPAQQQQPASGDSAEGQLDDLESAVRDIERELDADGG